MGDEDIAVGEACAAVGDAAIDVDVGGMGVDVGGVVGVAVGEALEQLTATPSSNANPIAAIYLIGSRRLIREDGPLAKLKVAGILADTDHAFSASWVTPLLTKPHCVHETGSTPPGSYLGSFDLTTGAVERVAGTWRVSAYGGDGGPAADADVNVGALAVADNGDIYLVSAEDKLRVILGVAAKPAGS